MYCSRKKELPGKTATVHYCMQGTRASGRLLGFVALLGVTVTAVAAGAPAVPAYMARLAFRPPPPPSELVLVRFGLEEPTCSTFRSFRVEDGSGTPAPCQIALAQSNQVFLLVYTGGTGGRGSEFYVYGNESADAQSAAPIWTNALMRVGVTVRHRGSPTLPNTWERFLYFWERSSAGLASGVEQDFDIDDFPGMMVRLGEQQPATAGGGKAWRDRRGVDTAKRTAWRERTGRPALFARFESQVMLSSDGEYRFALCCRDSGYILVDGELVLAVESGAEPSSWQVGSARRLQAGLHSLEVMSASLDPVVRVGWAPPGATEVTILPPDILLAPGPVLDGRLEVRGRFMHASIAFTPMEPYGFRDLPGVFAPVRFTDVSRNPGGAMLRRRWSIDGCESEGASITHTFTEPGTYAARLFLSDSLGATGSCERAVDVKARVVKEYAVDFEVGGLPAACFAGDSLSPYLVAWGKGPPGVDFAVTWSFLDAQTNTLCGGETNVVLLGPAVKVDFGKEEVGEFRFIDWKAAVAGKELRGGRIAFDGPPFVAWPQSVVADRLLDRTGARIVLVTSMDRTSESYCEPERPPPEDGPVVLLDDTLVPYTIAGEVRETYAAVLARLLGKARPVEYASIAPSEESGGSLKSLAKFAALPKVAGEVPGRTVVLSMGVHDMLLGGDVESFERGLGVMVDKLLAENAAVVLATPPPYPGMEARMRPWAVAVRRVADARGLYVADLYTAFIGMRGQGGPLFELDTLGLTPRGHRLAADRIARALGKRGVISEQ